MQFINHLEDYEIILILIGDELLSGKVQESNGLWLANFLTTKHLQLKNIEIIEDDQAKIHEVLLRYWDRPNQKQIIIFSGGLGPTRDDVTKNAVANFFKTPLKSHPELSESLKVRYQQRGKEWTPEYNQYHLFPKNFTPIDNTQGLAPGIYYTQNYSHLICAPGVPIEFQQMIRSSFSSFYNKKNTQVETKDSFLTAISCIKTRYVSEEEIFSKLCPELWDKLTKIGKVSSLPQPMGVDIYITLKQKNAKQIQEKIQDLKKTVRETALNPYIWHIGEESLGEKIVLEAKEKGITLSFCESCTGGLASHEITNIPGASEIFYGSIVSYSNSVKKNLLKVDPKTLELYGAVSKENALEMAKGGLKQLDSDICLSFTGIAGPQGGSKKKPVGTVAIGIATKSKSYSSIYYFHGDRERLKRRFVLQGFHLLLDTIREF